MTIFIAEYQCPTDYTKCDNKLACIPEIYFCDDFHDCRDNSDESTKNCVTTLAPEGEYLLLVSLHLSYLFMCLRLQSGLQGLPLR